MDRYATAFRTAGVTAAHLPSLTAHDLVDLGVRRSKHRHVLLDAIVTLKTAAGGLRQSAEAVLAAWEDMDGLTVPEALLAPLEALRAALQAHRHPPDAARRTKQARVLAMLRQ